MKRVNTRGIKRKQTRTDGKFNVQLEEIPTLYHPKPSILAQVLSLKQGKNFFVNQSSQASITQF